MQKIQQQKKYTPFRDRSSKGNLQLTPQSYQLNKEFKTVNNENTDTSNQIIQIRRRSKQSQPDEFACKESYQMSRFRMDEQSDMLEDNLKQKIRSQSQQYSLKLTQSQEVFFKRPPQQSRVDRLQPNSSLTFGSIKQGLLKTSMSSNSEMLQDKKMKNQVLDDIIRKAAKENVKSSQMLRRSQRPDSIITCANQDGKKAKYRLLNDPDDQELFYCSKCSILLMQQGFRVEEINHQKKADSRRKKEFDGVFSKIMDLQGRLKYHLNSLESETDQLYQQAKFKLDETYEIITFIVEQMKASDNQALAQSQQKVNIQKKKQKAKLRDRFNKLQIIRQELERICYGDVSQSQLPMVIESYTSTINSYQRYEPLQYNYVQESIEEKLERLINDVNQHYIARKSQFEYQSNNNNSISRDEQLPEQTHKPFRNLFPEEETNSKYKHSRPDDEYMCQQAQFSPSFKKIM